MTLFILYAIIKVVKESNQINKKNFIITVDF
ncbi:hypothetical protein PI27_gp116 [Listeria phage WIL-1]|nr:hypothetical protein PI27_gp116 [Listeria phage WIL-1]